MYLALYAGIQKQFFLGNRTSSLTIPIRQNGVNVNATVLCVACEGPDMTLSETATIIVQGRYL